MNKSKISSQSWMFLMLLICMGVFLFWKAPYGHIFKDEPFMVTLGHRLLKGDCFFIHEWNLAQTTGLFFAPVIYIYKMFKGNLEGAILFCRYVYVVWWLFVGVILYRRLKQYGWISFVAVTIFWLYTPLDEMTLTYNAMALSLLVIFASYFLIEGSKILDYLNGVVLAFSVLAYPTLITVYIVYFFAVLIKNLFKINTNKNIARMFSWQLFIRITISATSLAILFLIFLSANLEELIVSLRCIFSFKNSNETGWFDLADRLLDTFPLQVKFGGFVFLISLFDKHRNKRSLLYLGIQSLLFFMSAIFVLRDMYDFNIIMIPISFVGAQAFVLTKKKDYVVLLSLGSVGFIFALCGYFSSDTGLLAFSNGFVIIAIVTVIFIYQFYKEFDAFFDKKFICRSVCVLLSFVLIIQVSSELYIKITRSYWDEFFPNLNTKISCGIAKGIKTNHGSAEYYNKVYQDVLKINNYTEEKKDLNFLSLSLIPSMYIDLDYNYGTFSSWTYTNNVLSFEVLNEKLTLYYQLNPSKTADIIYVRYEDEEHLNKIQCIDFSEYTEYLLETGKIYINKEIV